MYQINVPQQLALLGRKAKDKITGLEGVIASISFDLSGCCQGLLNTGKDKDGKLRESYWFDTSRFNISPKSPVMEVGAVFTFNSTPDKEVAHGAISKPTPQ